ncbi:NADH-quinone oxidoreductase subunit M [candidate division KSB1 bacterium]
MIEFGFPILSLILFFPMLGVLMLLLLPRKNPGTVRTAALMFALVEFCLSLVLWVKFRLGDPGMQFRETMPWIDSLGISYQLGIDGISLFLVILTTFLTALSVLVSYTIDSRVKEHMALLLALETGMIGAFVSINLFLFYIFWEAMLIPMYLLIGVWGGPRRIYAALKFFLFTMFGSLFMLLAIIGVYYLYYRQTGVYTFDLLQLYNLQLTPGLEKVLFGAFALSFAIKVPIFPFHTWLPDAHVEAPTAGSVILAGVLLKMGTYGFLRFCWPLFPNASQAFLPLLCILGIVGIIYGALMSMVQPDLKKLVAYSSISHLGFVILGLYTLNIQGVSGALLQMINHGISTGALFILVGYIYERRHTRMIDDYGGLARSVPVYSAMLLIVSLSSLGLPGMNGFVGEFLILVGAFRLNWIYAAFAALGIILAAVYLLWMYRRIAFGEITKPENRSLADLNFREIAIMVPLLAAIFGMGLYPKPFLERMEPSIEQLVRTKMSVERDNPADSELEPPAEIRNLTQVEKL